MTASPVPPLRLTVPAPEAQPIAELPLFIAREVPASWSDLPPVALG